ncbi:hypothetical protein [Clostridium tagluense]|uniref:hypothetical protein n=1 Tax=Clostridium tagluense TaxID=360422 RepID=UPI001C6ED0BE|nr:hypothetical protein [Clostridium tagluense]MBW9159470.1 hypothetical protein [Clostridium tagluense]WLC68478.1 hypothetical protein KTC93_25530 [Clostridium tagluense]
MSKKRPVIIEFIGGIAFLGALVSIVIVLFPNFSKQLGFDAIPVSNFSVGIMQVVLPIILLIASYGFLRLKIWGYWLMVIYSMFFLIVFIIGLIQNKPLFASQNFIGTFITLMFLLPTKRYFNKG